MTAMRNTLRMLASALMSCLLVLSLVPMPALAEEPVELASEPGQELLAPTPEDTDLELGPTVEGQDMADDASDEGGIASDDGIAIDDAVPSEEPSSDEVVVEDADEASLDVITDDQDAIEVLSDDTQAVPEGDGAIAAQSEAAQQVRVAYRTHQAGGSWTSMTYDGQEAMSADPSAGIDAIKLKLDAGSTGVSGSIAYRTHVSKKGWLGWVQDGARGGLARQLSIEALQIKLTGAMAKKYDVYYSVNVQGKGWLKWAKNGATTGSVGMGLRVQGIKVQLVARGAAAPSSKHVNYKSILLCGSPVSVRAKVRGQGWHGAVGNNVVAGTTGAGLRLQALSVTLPSGEVPGEVLVRGHIQDTGWTAWKTKTISAASSKRIEALRLKLSGEAQKKYDIYYRVHVSRLGWMAWAKNGKTTGTKGLSLPIEAVQVYVVKKGGKAPSSNGSIEAVYYTGTSIRYRAHCESYGWRNEVKNGAVGGTTGKGKRLEAFTARLSGGTITGGIDYDGYVAGSGWQGGVSNDAVCGTLGQYRALQAIKMSLSGRAAAVYDVWYRAHIADAGWLGWAKNGEVAGAPDTGKDVQAIQVRLLPKGSAAPGSTANHVVDTRFFHGDMVMRAQGYSSPTGWLILVDVDQTRLGVFRGSRGNWKLYNTWKVSCGAPGTSTVRGVFSVGDRGYVFGHGYSCYYYTQFYGAYLFHSIKYYEGTFDVMDGRLGEHISMGCVRMDINNAKWIYDNIPTYTTVVTY
ncbi:MAG: L,D-transpeptidase family protein [Atopobiaceae bacterium]|nr:L,D-transpeptidase family protein [Atopobiaceae bacterium]